MTNDNKSDKAYVLSLFYCLAYAHHIAYFNLST